MKLSELEKQAQETLGDFMGGFEADEACRIICCPWLRWRADMLLEHKWKGVLIMQDWGNESERIGDAISYIKDAGEAREKTMSNLYKSGWGKVVWGQDPTWLVTNAVWGVRKKNTPKEVDKCGYLGDDTHAAAFPVWSQVLVNAAKMNPALKVVFAGNWARFEDTSKNCPQLKEFLNKWLLWFKQKREKCNFLNNLDEIGLERLSNDATAYFCSHPSIWKERNCWDGPPKSCV